jgi:hypothetical protein
MKRLDVALSAQQVLFYYCARADQDTGETNVSVEKTSQDLGIRKDHVSEHDRKLVREGLITVSIGEFGGRIVRLLAPWRPRAERNGQPAQRAEKQTASQDLGKRKRATTQNLGSPLNAVTQNLGESTQNLGSPLDETQADYPKLGEVTQNLGEPTQNLGLHIRNNQPMEPAQIHSGAIAPEVAAGSAESSSPKPKAKKPPSKPKSEFHNHPAVVAYRQVLGFNAVNAAQADLIAEATGAEIDRAPPEWLKFLRELAETGNKHAHNVRVMVQAFVRYKANVPLAEALRQAWDETQGRTNDNGGTFNGRRDAAKARDARTTEELGIRIRRL